MQPPHGSRLTPDTRVVLSRLRFVTPVLLGLSLVELAGCGGGGSRALVGSDTGVVATRSLVGSWGGADTENFPATFVVTATGAQLKLPCNSTINIDKPLTADASGHFSVTGLEPHIGTTGANSFRVEGTVVEGTLTLTVSYAAPGLSYIPPTKYIVVLNQPPLDNPDCCVCGA